MNPIRYFTNKQSRTIGLLFLLSFFFPVTTYSIHHPNTSLPVGKSNQFPAYTWKNLTLQGKPTAVACILTIPLSQMTDRIGRLKLQTQEAETRRGLETVYDQTLRMGQQLQNALELPEVVHIRPIANVPPVEAESTIAKQLTCVARLIEEHLGNPDLNVQFLSEKSGIVPKTLYRLLKKYQGATPVDYIRQIRLQKAALLLEQHRFTVAEVCYLVGFNTPSYFAKCFQKQYGKKPSEYGDAD